MITFKSRQKSEFKQRWWHGKVKFGNVLPTDLVQWQIENIGNLTKSFKRIQLKTTEESHQQALGVWEALRCCWPRCLISSHSLRKDKRGCVLYPGPRTWFPASTSAQCTLTEMWVQVREGNWNAGIASSSIQTAIWGVGRSDQLAPSWTTAFKASRVHLSELFVNKFQHKSL